MRQELRSPQTALVGVLCLATAYAVVSGSKAAAVPCLAVIGVAGVILAFTHPTRAFMLSIFLLAVVPVYAAPNLNAFLLLPGVLLSWLVAAVLLTRQLVIERARVRLTPVDGAVLIFTVLMGISLGFSKQVSPADYLSLVFDWGGFYLSARFILREAENPVAILAVPFAVAVIVLVPFTLIEAAGGHNFFYNFNINASEFAVWSNHAQRLGETRAEASFGHPIAFSMFLATSMLLSLSMYVNRSGEARRWIWLALAAVAVVLQTFTLARTGWLIIVLGTGMLLAFGVRGVARRRLSWIIAATVAMLLVVFSVVAVPNQVQGLFGSDSTSSGQAIKSSTDYRGALLDRALEPGVLHLWGNPVSSVTRTLGTSHSIDNAYVLIADQWGLIPMAALILIVLSLVPALLAARGTKRGGDPVIPIAALTNLFALFLVAFITQQQSFVWLLIGAAAAVAERRLPQPAPAQTKPRRRVDSPLELGATRAG